MKHQPDQHVKNDKSLASSEPEPVRWWLNTAPAKRPVGKPRRIQAVLEPEIDTAPIEMMSLHPVELPTGYQLPDMLTMAWAEPVTDQWELYCEKCRIPGWTTGEVLRRHGPLMCPQLHRMSVVVPPGVNSPQVKAVRGRKGRGWTPIYTETETVVWA